MAYKSPLDKYKTPTLEIGAGSKTKTTKTTKTNDSNIGKSTPYTPLQSYTTSSKKSSGSKSSGGSSSSSYSVSLKPYLDAMLAAYNQGAESDRALAEQVYNTTIRNLDTSLERAQQSYNEGKAIAENTYNTTANNLLTSLRRYQAENAKNVENQRKSYITEQAALESARFEADRQNRISNAARGLGGSGLQQLSQLQNLLGQGQDISNLALENRDEMEDLRTALANYTEDYETDLAQAVTARDTALNSLLTTLNNKVADVETGKADALTTRSNTLSGISSDLANKIASAQYDFGQNAYNAEQTARAQAAARAAQSAAASKEADNINALLTYYETDLQDAIKGLKKNDSKTANALLSEYLEYGANIGGLSTNQFNTFNRNLRSILSNYGF